MIFQIKNSQRNQLSWGLKNNQCNLIYLALIFISLLNTNVVNCSGEHADEHAAHEEEDSSRDFSKGQGWFYGILFTFLIGVTNLICTTVVLIVRKKTKFDFKPLTEILIAMAAGALIGDAVLHLIPEGYGLHAHGDEENVAIPETELGTMILVGIFTFFIVEKVLASLGITHKHCSVQQCSMKKQDEINNTEEKNIELQQQPQQQIQVQTSSNRDLQAPAIVQIESDDGKVKEIQREGGEAVQTQQNSDGSLSNSQQQQQAKKDEKNNENKEVSFWKGKENEGYLSLLGDIVCHILDGLAIGAVFAGGDKSSSVSIIIAIIAHEIPQEIGEVGVLLFAKFSSFQILLANGLINLFTILGCIISLALGEMGNKSNRLLTLFIAGNFIYVAASDMIPLLKESKNKFIILGQIIALGVGVGTMYLVLEIEESGHDDHGHDEHNH